MKDRGGKLLTQENALKERWAGYFEDLMDMENPHASFDTEETTSGPVPLITTEEAATILKKMGSDRTSDPDDIPIEAWLCPREASVDALADLLNQCLVSGEIPADWRQSELTFVFKENGDSHECKNYRGIKLL